MRTDEFLNYLRLDRNYSTLTVVKYEASLRMFEDFFKSERADIEWETVDPDLIRNWMEKMVDDGNRASTVNGRLSAVRSFYRYALKRGLVSRNPAYGVTGPKKEKCLPKFIREKDMDALLSPEMWNQTYEDVCARTILMVFYETGIRIAEMVTLEDGMVDFTNSQLKVTGKRNKQRIIPFGEELAVALDEYISLRDQQVERRQSGLFLTVKGKRMTDQGATRKGHHAAETFTARAATYLRNDHAQSRGWTGKRQETAGTRKSRYYGNLHAHHIRTVKENIQ